MCCSINCSLELSYTPDRPHHRYNGFCRPIHQRHSAFGHAHGPSSSHCPGAPPHILDLPHEYVVCLAAAQAYILTPPGLLRKYTKEHEWIDIAADHKTAVIGISEYAAEQLGDVVYVELPEVSGQWIEQGDAMGAVESVKSASDILAPISVKITAVNQGLEEKPSTINQVPEDDSHGGGWIAKVELNDAAIQQTEGLMDAEAYKAFTTGDE